MTWPQAQNYCREHHTDLASGLQQIEDEEFKKEETQSNKSLWIGLFNDTWKWSDESNFSFRNWDLESFEDEEVNKKCAMAMSDGKWSSDDCNNTKPFFCYNDKVILINEKMEWMEALNYCRSNHRDLVSITNPHQQRWVQERAKKAVSEYVWLGLRYTCSMDSWFWVNDNLVCYENWASEEKADKCEMAAAMGKDGPNKWFKRADTSTFNFICALK
ncbi:macrophage mannose receptor 1-like [Sebastes umbrosus]|uniref:macrophage mannose receptor 1-like n=1 Tax=Sebastes umbrosus TaxID=72105 RepID=UPI00189D8734|nr:macrophage mannose receptor 1-like [Sebastes umbrosus]